MGFQLEKASSWPGVLRGRTLLDCIARMEPGKIQLQTVAVSGSHLAMALGGRGQGGRSILCMFDGLADEEQPGPSDAQQRAFAQQLAGQEIDSGLRLPHVLLGEYEQRVLGLQFFQPAFAPGEDRLLVAHEEGLMRMWAWRGPSKEEPQEGPGHSSSAGCCQWVLAATFPLSVQGPICRVSFDGGSGRLMYIEEIRGGFLHGSEGGAGPPERLRVVSREIAISPATEETPEVVTVGCAVSIVQSEPHVLETIKAGRQGCWVVMRGGRLAYNDFKTRRFVSTALPVQEEEGGGPLLLFALHPLTEQLVCLEASRGGGGGGPSSKAARLWVLTYEKEGGEVTAKLLHQTLLLPSCSTSNGQPAVALPCCLSEARALAVHRHVAALLLPAHLALFHLRTGALWALLPLPSRCLAPSSSSSLTDGSPPALLVEPTSSSSSCYCFFWLDRDPPGALGLWCDQEVFRLALPSAHEEQQHLLRQEQQPMAEEPGQGGVTGGLEAAVEVARQYGPSMRPALAQRALDLAQQQQQQPGAGAELGLPLVLRLAMLLAGPKPAVAGPMAGESEQREALRQEVGQALGELEWLRAEMGRLQNYRHHGSTTSSSGGGGGAGAGSDSASVKEVRQLFDNIRSRSVEVTPLLLAVEPVLREWLQLEGRDDDEQGQQQQRPAKEATPEGGGAGGSQQAKSSGAGGGGLTALELAERVTGLIDPRPGAAGGEGGLAGLLEREVCEDYGRLGLLDPSVLYYCSVGDDGYLEVLALLLYRLRPALLVTLVHRLHLLQRQGGLMPLKAEQQQQPAPPSASPSSKRQQQQQLPRPLCLREPCLFRSRLLGPELVRASKPWGAAAAAGTGHRAGPQQRRPHQEEASPAGAAGESRAPHLREQQQAGAGRGEGTAAGGGGGGPGWSSSSQPGTPREGEGGGGAGGPFPHLRVRRGTFSDLEEDEHDDGSSSYSKRQQQQHAGPWSQGSRQAGRPLEPSPRSTASTSPHRLLLLPVPSPRAGTRTPSPSSSSSSSSLSLRPLSQLRTAPVLHETYMDHHAPPSAPLPRTPRDTTTTAPPSSSLLLLTPDRKPWGAGHEGGGGESGQLPPTNPFMWSDDEDEDEERHGAADEQEGPETYLEEEGDEEEEDMEGVQFYERALRLLPRPVAGRESAEQHDAYLALLEGARRVVDVVAHLLSCGEEERWDDALAVLDDLGPWDEDHLQQPSIATASAGAGAAAGEGQGGRRSSRRRESWQQLRHQVFRRLLQAALLSSSWPESAGRVEAVMARRPPDLTPSTLVKFAQTLLARRQQAEGAEGQQAAAIQLGPLKRCLLILYSEKHSSNK